ncbi:MAG TPA: LytR C-terminal domain-containing protein [Syntrophales bacterium]|nr:LytR C-terminal domain-containing protein [Syntrophales bacterium]
MKGKLLIFLLLSGVLAFSGCAGLSKCMDGSYEKSIKELTTANESLKKEVAGLEASVKAQEKTLAERQAEIARLEEERKALQSGMAGLNEEVRKLKKELQPEKQKDAAAEAQVLKKDLKIKILAGNTRLSSARALSKKLSEAGYSVGRVDRAPRSFAITTVFHAAGLANEAKQVAQKIGANAVTKPMTWSSMYQLIIVVGRK